MYTQSAWFEATIHDMTKESDSDGPELADAKMRLNRDVCNWKSLAHAVEILDAKTKEALGGVIEIMYQIAEIEQRGKAPGNVRKGLTDET